MLPEYYFTQTVKKSTKQEWNLTDRLSELKVVFW